MYLKFYISLNIYSLMVKGVVYGGFWLRVVAAMVDGIILNIVFYPLKKFMPFSLSMMFAMQIIISWFYFALLESSSWQATIGKKAFGLKVTDMNLKRISFLRATGREFGKYLSMAILFIGFFMIAFTERKQGLHDKLAECLVIKEK